MLHGLFNRRSFNPDAGTKWVEGVVLYNEGTGVSLDWEFGFCVLDLDNGDIIDVSITNGPVPPFGTRVRGRMYDRGIFEGRKHFKSLTPVSQHSPRSLAKRAIGKLQQKFGK